MKSAAPTCRWPRSAGNWTRWSKRKRRSTASSTTCSWPPSGGKRL